MTIDTNNVLLSDVELILDFTPPVDLWTIFVDSTEQRGSPLKMTYGVTGAPNRFDEVYSYTWTRTYKNIVEGAKDETIPFREFFPFEEYQHMVQNGLVVVDVVDSSKSTVVGSVSGTNGLMSDTGVPNTWYMNLARWFYSEASARVASGA